MITGVAQSLTAMTEGWAGFRRDPRWAEIVKKTNDRGELVNSENHKRPVRTYWSRKFTREHENRIHAGVYVLRTYTCPDPNKDAGFTRRFR